MLLLCTMMLLVYIYNEIAVLTNDLFNTFTDVNGDLPNVSIKCEKSPCKLCKVVTTNEIRINKKMRFLASSTSTLFELVDLYFGFDLVCLIKWIKQWMKVEVFHCAFALMGTPTHLHLIRKIVALQSLDAHVSLF